MSDKFKEPNALGVTVFGAPVVHCDAGEDAQAVGSPGLLTALKFSETNTCAFARLAISVPTAAHSSSILFDVIDVRVILFVELSIGL